jgi:phosphate transport system substrate-binding protein
MRHFLRTAIMVSVLFLLSIGSAHARDRIRIVGSISVVPFLKIIAENFAHHWDFPPPSVEDTGTGKGFRLFGSGVGYQYPDVVATPRPMTRTEWEFCRKNGVDAVTEIVIGLDAIVLANPKSSQQIGFSVGQLYGAMAEKVEEGGHMVPNPYTRWSQIDEALPNIPIQIMAPEPGSPTEDALIQLVMIRGCESSPAMLLLEDAERFRLCRMLRPYSTTFVKGLKYPSRMLKWLSKNPGAFVFLNYAIYQDYRNRLAANPINGATPTLESISSGKYPLKRPIYLYAKIPHVEGISGLQKFLYEATSERAIGPEGYLVQKGFIPLEDRGRNHARDLALSLAPISR